MPALSNPITANGNYDAVLPKTGLADLIITGSFGGGTVQLQVNNPAALTEFAPVDNGTWTSAGTRLYQGDPLTSLRFVVSGATAPSINIFVGKATN